MNVKRKIIYAAKKLFLEKDFKKINIRDICALAGVTTGAFYYYIGSKQNLMQIFYEEFVENVEKKIENNKNVSFPKKIYLIASCYIENVEFYGYQGYKYFFGFDLYNFTKLNQYRTIYDLINKIVGEAINKKEIKNFYAKKRITQIILIIIKGSIFEWCLSDGKFDLKENIFSSINILMNELKCIEK